MLAKKHIAAAALAIVLLLTLAACGGKKENNSAVATPSQREVSQSPVSPAEASVPEETPDLSEYTIVLTPEDADLSDTIDVILEADSGTSNLGGWGAYDNVYWTFDVETAGTYAVTIEYSRASADSEVMGSVYIGNEDEPELYYFEFLAEVTADDWSVYETLEIADEYFEEGEYELILSPGTYDTYIDEDYFINLRNVKLVLTEPGGDAGAPGGPDGGEVTLESFEGTWYGYFSGTTLEISGGSYDIDIVSHGVTSSGTCELDGDTLKLTNSNGEQVYELRFTPYGSVSAGNLGHLRPLTGTEPGEPPIDLSESGYLGEWYSEERDSTITLGYKYTVGQTAGYDGEKIYVDGIFEPYGNRLVLAYSYALQGEEYIFDGGEAVYDPDAQTLTTAGQYVYERVSYGGGRKIVSDEVWYFDTFDWSSPYHTRDEIASKIIAVWEEHGEDVAPEYLSVDGLIEALENYDGDEEFLFIRACEIAGIDYTTYQNY